MQRYLFSVNFKLFFETPQNLPLRAAENHKYTMKLDQLRWEGFVGITNPNLPS